MKKTNVRNALISLIAVVLAVLLSLCSVAGSVILDSHTYKSAAREDAYVEGIKSDIDEIVQNACEQTGLPEKIFEEQLADKNIEKLIKKNAANAALILKGRQAIYAISFDETALLQSMYDYYRDSTGVPAQGETQELLKQTASDICAEINAAVRVIDMEHLAYTYSEDFRLKTIRYMGNTGPLIIIILIGIALFLIYRNTKPGETSGWIWGISVACGISMLLPAGLLLILGVDDLISSAPSPQLASLYESAVNSTVTAFIELAVIWFVIAFFAIRCAIGKPVQLGKLLRKLQHRKSANPTDAMLISETTLTADSKSELPSVIKHAAADSLNTILWKRKK